MQNIGELFKSGNKVIDGPILLHTYPERNIYLLGEHHNINGSGKNDHIWTIIKQYALTHPKKQIKLFMEAVPSDVYLIRDNCNSPLSTTIKDLLTGIQIPSNIKPILINIRRVAPLSILEVVYDKPTFAALNIKDASVFTFHRHAKAFEKDFFLILDFCQGLLNCPNLLYLKWKTNYFFAFFGHFRS